VGPLEKFLSAREVGKFPKFRHFQNKKKTRKKVFFSIKKKTHFFEKFLKNMIFEKSVSHQPAKLWGR